MRSLASVVPGACSIPTGLGVRILTVSSKSQLAIELCYRTRERSPDCWIFWVHASSPERLYAGVREMADVLQLPGRRDANADVLQLVEQWLRGSGKEVRQGTTYGWDDVPMYRDTD